MDGVPVKELISALIFGVVLWIVFLLVKWGVEEFGLPAIIVKISGILLGLVFLLKLVSLLGVS